MATYQILFEKSGNLSVADDVSPWYICSAPYGLKLLGVDLAVKTPPQNASIMIDIEWSSDGITWASIFGVPFLYGIHDGTDNNSTLRDLTANFTTDLVGLIIDNVSDGSTGIIQTVFPPSYIYAPLLGGDENDWDNGDGYTIAVAGGIRPGEHIGVGGIPSVTELAYGGLLRLDIEQCGVSPNRGADLTVSLRVRQ